MSSQEKSIEPNQVDQAVAKKKVQPRKKRNKRSWVWAHYDDGIDAEGKDTGICSYCKVVIAADTQLDGTSGLINHFKRCKEYPGNAQIKQARLALQPGSEHGKGTLVTWKFDQKLIRNALVRMIIIDELSFKFVENEGFKQFMSVVCPGFDIPSRHTIARDCVALYQSECETMKKFFKISCQRVCLTSDTWTSNQRINYMVVTAHFIDNDWKLHKRIINFCPISSHKGEAISSAIEKCVREWEIDDKVFTITLDNASSNDSAMTNFRKKMSKWESSILNGEFVHVRCIAHILNLVVSDGLKDIDSSIEKVRNVIRYVRQSPARLSKFKECAKAAKIESKKSLCLDVPTRWNSTYSMLDVAVIFEAAFDRLEEVDPYFKHEFQDIIWVEKRDEYDNVVYGPNGVPQQEMKIIDKRHSSKDWDKCRKFAKLLKHFFDLTLRISASLYVTSNNVLQEIFEVYCLLKDWEASDDVKIKSMGVEMKKIFDKYWRNPEKMNNLLYISMVLDPRYKLEFVEYTLCRMHGQEVGKNATKKVESTLRRLYDDYKVKKEPKADGSNSQSNSDVAVDETLNQKETRTRSLVAEFKKQKSLGAGFGISSSSEIEKYLNEAHEDCEKELDILNWWKQNSHSHRFPILSSIAGDVLAIPVSTVASESAFSTGGRVLDGFRSSLTPKVVESLICTQDWLRASNKEPLFLDEELEEVEKIEEEMAKVMSNASPEATPMEI